MNHDRIQDAKICQLWFYHKLLESSSNAKICFFVLHLWKGKFLSSKLFVTLMLLMLLCIGSLRSDNFFDNYFSQNFFDEYFSRIYWWIFVTNFSMILLTTFLTIFKLNILSNFFDEFLDDFLWKLAKKGDFRNFLDQFWDFILKRAPKINNQMKLHVENILSYWS